MQLVRQLTFIDIYLTSLGYIIGAGIYILIGKTAKYADKQTWLAFIAGILALLNTISYTEYHIYIKRMENMTLYQPRWEDTWTYCHNGISFNEHSYYYYRSNGNGRLLQKQL